MKTFLVFYYPLEIEVEIFSLLLLKIIYMSQFSNLSFSPFAKQPPALIPDPAQLSYKCTKTRRKDTKFFTAFVLHFHSNKTLLPYINE